jgi:trk system potassium uptake protein TrkH
MLPYLFSGTFTSLSDAFFESVSGLTTTGASVLNDIEAVPAGVLFWRSLTQWIGGMGIIVLMVAIFPLLGIGGVELFVAEAPGSSLEKIHPRIKEIAKRLWFIYLGLTTLLMFILWALGMTFYEAINHALTTMATGGFSTKNASVAHFTSPAIQYTILIFMFLAGINYTVLYYGLTRKFDKVWRSDEFKTYLALVLLLTVVVTSTIYSVTDLSFEQSFRDAAFQIVSIVTTTGFVSADYTSWTPALTLLFFFLLFMGACAGSTSGGIKIIRHLVFFKNSFLEFKRLLHPNAIIRTKIDNQVVVPKVMTHILVFLLLYLMLFFFGSLIMVAILNDFDQPLLSALGAVATALGNVGPALADLSPVDNFAAVPASGKYVLTVLMLLGRLELFTILVVFTPYFWRSN